MLQTDTQCETGQVLAAMLTEHTGTHMCDSGGSPRFDEHGHYTGSEHGYGRHWERNQGRDFDSEPASVVSFRYGVEVTHSVYHWLAERLEYDADMQGLFDEFRDTEDPDGDRYWLDLMESFPAWLKDRGHSVAGLYGDGKPFTVNTYNGEDLLSQVLQYTYFECDDTPYVLLQMHGGCDVRGGYTAPRAFRPTDSDGSGILDNARATIYCEPRSDDVPGQLGLDGKPVPQPEPHYWTTDDGCHWYADGCCGLGVGTQLEQYDRVDIDDRTAWEAGSLCVDADGNGYCPICGGRLQAGF